MAKVFKPKNLLEGKILTEEQVIAIADRVKELVANWNGTDVVIVETTENPASYWIKVDGECKYDTLNVEGYIDAELINDILNK